MFNRIADLRNAPKTLDQAMTLFNELAQHCIALTVRDAQCEKKIARLKAEHAGETEEFRKYIETKEIALKEFITSHRDWFQYPRKIKTDFGNFGLQTVNDVVIEDEDAARKALLKRGYDDCFQTIIRLAKNGIKARLEAGEKIPGCVVRSGDTAGYKVEKSLIDRAKNEGGHE